MTVYVPSVIFSPWTLLKCILLLSALKWNYTMCTIWQLLYYFPGSVIFNLAYVGIRCCPFVIILEYTLSTC